MNIVHYLYVVCYVKALHPKRVFGQLYCTVSTRLIYVGLGEINEAGKTYLDKEQLQYVLTAFLLFKS